MDTDPPLNGQDGDAARLKRAVDRALKMHEAAVDMGDPMIRLLAEMLLLELGRRLAKG